MNSQSIIRYAVVGLGHITQVAALPGFHQAKNSELVVLITDDTEKARELEEMYGVKAYHYDEFETALQQERIDAVFIGLPNHLHREYTERAARIGVHVLCEKPMATTEEDCQAMIRCCEQAGVKLMIAYRLHLAESHLQAIEAIKSGVLGEVRCVSSLFGMQVKGGNIRVKREAGGGTLFDIGIYCINAARYLFQAEPYEVLGMTASSDDERFAEVEEMTCAVLRFPEDRMATFMCSFGSADLDQLDIVGTKGTLHMEPAYTYHDDVIWTLKIGAKVEKITFKKSDQFGAELLYFSSCILNDSNPEPSGYQGLADVRIINALYDSAQAGRTLRIDPVAITHRPAGDQQIILPPVDEPAVVNAEAPSRD